MKIKWIIILFLSLLLVLVNCDQGEGEGPISEQPDNPIPVLNTISPNSKVSHLPFFTLTATGSNFVSSSKIFFNDSEKQTTYVSSTELTCQIDPADISGSSVLKTDSLNFSEINKEVAIVKVRNPSPGGGDSNSMDFLIQSNHTFCVPKNISNNSRLSYNPVIAVCSTGNIHVAWYDGTTGNWEIFFSRSEDNGGTWTQPINVSSNTGKSLTPSIVTDSAGNIHVVWYDEIFGQREIYYTRSINNGNSWTTPINISNTSADSWNPSITTDSVGNINVVWYDGSMNNMEVYFTSSNL